MDLITQLVESRLYGQESTAAHACLLAANIQVSIDGHGRALDNVSCERLSHSVISKNISLNQYDLARHLQTDLPAYFDLYSHERPHPPKCTLSFPFRGPNIGTHHSLPVSSAEMWYTEHMVFRTVWVMGAHFDGRQSKTNEEPPSPAPNGPALLTYPNQTELENIISPCRSLSSSPLDPFYLFP